VRTATNTSRWLAIAALVCLGAACGLAQTTSRAVAVGMSATVLPNLKLQPRIFTLQNGGVSADVMPESAEQFLVHARLTGGNEGLLQIPVWLSSNVRSFVVSATIDNAINGTVQMLGSGNDKISMLSSQKPLQSSSIFALGLPGPGHLSASGTLNGTIQIVLAGLPKGETKEVRIRLNISQH
jgi:hypothetical protein